MMNNERRLLVFAREPLPGRVKTRLIPELGEKGATDLYERMLAYTLELSSGIGDVSTELWCDFVGPEAEKCSALAREHGMRLYQQEGDDLGLRMYSAFAYSSKCGLPAVLIGSDCPGLTRDYLQEAFLLLTKNDVVLGPAEDGGYVLIGLNTVERRLFENLPWGTSEVLELTRERLQEMSCEYAELSPLQDVDRPSDLNIYPDLV